MMSELTTQSTTTAKNTRHFISPHYLCEVIGLIIIVLGLDILPQAQAAWTESNTSAEVAGSMATQTDGSLFFSVTGSDATSLQGRTLTDQFSDLARCSVTRQGGVGGLIVSSDTGISGPVMAIYCGADGDLVVTYRMRPSEALHSFSPGIRGKTQLSLVRRGSMIYAYASDATATEPVVAVDFDFGPTPSVGVIALGDFACTAPQISSVDATQSLTVDVNSAQSGTHLTGTWQKTDDANALSGSHWVNDGTDAGASAKVQFNGLLAGSHDLWVRYSADPARTNSAHVDITGLSDPSGLALDQRVAGGVWVALGRYQVAQTADISVSLSPGSPGSGTLSIDAVHYLWSEWVDADHDGIADAWEALNGANPLVADAQADSVGAGMSNLERFRKGSGADHFASVMATPDANGRVVLYVNGTTGDDNNNGLVGQPVTGAWIGQRAGPKKSITASLSAVGEVRAIELHLAGDLDLPAEGFQGHGGAAFDLIPGNLGTNLGVVPAPPVPTQN